MKTIVYARPNCHKAIGREVIIEDAILVENDHNSLAGGGRYTVEDWDAIFILEVSDKRILGKLANFSNVFFVSESDPRVSAVRRAFSEEWEKKSEYYKNNPVIARGHLATANTAGREYKKQTEDQ